MANWPYHTKVDMQETMKKEVQEMKPQSTQEGSDSLVPRRSPSFPSLAIRYKPGRGPGNEANVALAPEKEKK